MCACAAALTVYWMVNSGIPVSTSQSIVGAIIGWNFYSGKETDYGILSQIVSTWILCPLLAGIIAILLYWLIRFGSNIRAFTCCARTATPALPLS